jgi:hypothetical protein
MGALDLQMREIQSISARVKELPVGEIWAVVHSFDVGQFFIEHLVSAVTKNYRSFVAAAGEDWTIVGLFGSAEEAANAVTAWMRTPGAKRAQEGEIM